MNKKTKLAIGIGAVLATAIIVGVAASSAGGDAAHVRIEAIGQRDLVATVSASGWIRPNRKVDVQSDIMGRITQLAVKEGERVTKGQILLRIDPSQYEAGVARARAAVSEAQAREAQTRANVIQSERAYQRLKDLAANPNLVSKQQLEEAETQVLVQKELLEAARFGVVQTREAMNEAVEQLNKTVIRAPMNGIITRLNVEEGETAIIGTMNNAGSLLLTVADLGVMEAVVRVDETDIPEIKLGDSASVEIDAFQRQKFKGRVTEISHSSVRPPESQSAAGGQGQAVDYEVVITLDNPPLTLRSDLSATAEIVTATRPKALAVPIIALTVREKGNVKALPSEDKKASEAGREAERDKADDQEGVFVSREGKAVFVPVQIGIAGREHFEILSGLKLGDSVVAGPYEAIRALEQDKPLRRLKEGTGPDGKPISKGKEGS
ncbi:MAG: efflux RND transporter periplasmic adaptor subunit [Longimicrobiales bacterium]